MLCLRSLAILSVSSVLCAQSYVVPAGTLPSDGTCNSFPFNTTDMRYQALVNASDLGGMPGWITGFGLAPCQSGVRSMATITVKMAHFGSSTLSTTFASNLNRPGPAITVLDTVNHEWHMVANTWNEIGLQDPFPYNGVDNLVVEVLVTGTAGASGTTHREGTHQRVYQGSYAGQPTGNSSTAAFKMKIYMGDANVQMFGSGCAGTAGTPAFAFTGTAQLGTPLSFDCTSAPANALVLLMLGSDTHLPIFPIDLTGSGAPGCRLYHDPGAIFPVTADGTGHATFTLILPTMSVLTGVRVYGSALVADPNANAAGVTATNYGRALLGN